MKTIYILLQRLLKSVKTALNIAVTLLNAVYDGTPIWRMKSVIMTIQNFGHVSACAPFGISSGTRKKVKEDEGASGWKRALLSFVSRSCLFSDSFRGLLGSLHESKGRACQQVITFLSIHPLIRQLVSKFMWEFHEKVPVDTSGFAATFSDLIFIPLQIQPRAQNMSVGGLEI